MEGCATARERHCTISMARCGFPKECVFSALCRKMMVGLCMGLKEVVLSNGCGGCWTERLVLEMSGCDMGVVDWLR